MRGIKCEYGFGLQPARLWRDVAPGGGPTSVTAAWSVSSCVATACCSRSHCLFVVPAAAANGMVLCASDAAHENVEPLSPPEGAAPGERVWFGEGNQSQVHVLRGSGVGWGRGQLPSVPLWQLAVVTDVRWALQRNRYTHWMVRIMRDVWCVHKAWWEEKQAFSNMLCVTTQAAPAEPNRVDKKKMWEALQPSLKTDENKVWGAMREIKVASITSAIMIVANVKTHSYSRR